MSGRIGSWLVVAGVVLASLAAPIGNASADPSDRDHPRQVDHRAAAARSALARAAEARGADASMALTDLFLARGALTGADRRAADDLLARPTDGARDPYGDGYTVPSRRKCTTHLCLHWVTRTSDRPPGQAWVDTTLRTLTKVWSFEVGRLDYRAPLGDGARGGDARFDVYLADVGSKGYYGYCAPERRKPGNARRASGFCVLDNDFSRQQFPAAPTVSLNVTAAHEFFHAIQYGYDVAEDRWMMEATAAWMEERFADGANDNRQYLPHGQLGDPSTPLDRFGFSGMWQYGNWLFFEHLSHHYGAKIVRQIWGQAATFSGAPNRWSLDAIRAVLGWSSLRLPQVYAAFAGGNTVPTASYTEGNRYQPAPLSSTTTLSTSAQTTGVQTVRLSHLTSRSVALLPGDDLMDPGWQVSLSFDLPDAARGSAAYVIVQRPDGTLQRLAVVLNAHGDATVTRAFAVDQVSRVILTLANGSSRMNCWQGKQWSCHGIPLDDGLDFSWSATLVPPPV